MTKLYGLVIKKISIVLFWLMICQLLIGFSNFFAPLEGLNTDLAYFNVWFQWYYALENGSAKGWGVIVCFCLGFVDFFVPIKLKSKYRKFFRTSRAAIAFAVLLPYVCLFGTMINSLAPEK